MKKLITILLFLIYGTTIGFAQKAINPGEGTSVNVICTACPTTTVRMPDTKIVDPYGNGDYTTVKEAASNSQPGWVILVKSGTYNDKISFTTSGTSALPIILKSFPGHSPVIDFTNSPDVMPRIEINGNYITIEGLEIIGGNEGIKILGDNVVIKNNYIHDNSGSGVVVVSASNNLIENNRIVSNGDAPGQCSGSPKHCHGIYFSSWQCVAPKNNTVLYNYIAGHGGRGIQFNGLGANGVCADHATGHVIKYNRIVDNSWGMVLYYSADNNIISNNYFVANNRPNTNDTEWYMLSLYDSENNIIESNVFYTTLPDMSGLYVGDVESQNNKVDKNLWRITYNRWRWKGDFRYDWLGYLQITGWDANGEVSVAVTE